MITIGVDPDSEKHAVAIYEDRNLHALDKWDLMYFIDYIQVYKSMTKLMFSIENVMSNQFIYSRNNQKNLRMQGKVGISVGRCMQSQVELMRVLDYYEIPYVLHKPTGRNWAKKKDQFEQITGWTGGSNEDTRSAAYFGYIALK